MHRMLRVSDGLRAGDIDDDEGMCCATPEIGAASGTASPESDALKVREILASKVQAAVAQVLTDMEGQELQELLEEFSNVFRIRFGRDPPVKVAPLKVHLKNGAVLVKSGFRRYPPTHLAYLEKHVRELEDAGLVYRNIRSRWAAAPRIVPKKDPGDLRMTIDSRRLYGANALAHAKLGSRDVCFARLYLLLYSRLDEGVLAIALPPRLSGVFLVCDPNWRVSYCQGVVDELFGDLLMHGLLGWLDDLLGYAESTVSLLALLRKVLSICLHFGLKLNPGNLFLWRSTRLERLQALIDMEPPKTGAERSSFYARRIGCAAIFLNTANWRDLSQNCSILPQRQPTRE
ncbi:hypothetical protein AeRB84_005688 [Aphanomyces euteiches]|nr:hypothetical protein AeRB84_005688 [Aphanomyces euteiches]